MKNLISRIFLSVFVLLMLALTVRGMNGNVDFNANDLTAWKEEGPFELSPERGRFALTYSLIENHSFFFSLPIAKFVVPDLGYKNGHYVSLFAPGVSFIVIPGYLIGKTLGASQVGVFAVISFFALINTFLISLIATKLGSSKLASYLAGLIFLFATPAFAYGVSLYQHHISTFLILLSLYSLLNRDNIWSLALVWFLCAASIPVDYPNLFLMFPIGFFALGRVLNIRKEREEIKISLKLVKTASLLSIFLPLSFFLWFNWRSYGNPLQFSGTVPSVKEIDSLGNPAAPKSSDLTLVNYYRNPEEQHKSVLHFFNSRNLINGLYVHLFSPERGVIIFTPVILFGILGIWILYKKGDSYLAALVGIVAFDILLYSLWGDVWGGWAFGSRYLIPFYAILAIFIGIALTRVSKKKLFALVFCLLMTYSIAVNTLGALTTSANPPKAESLALELLSGRQEKYSFDRNWEFLVSGNSKSFVFNFFANKYLSSQEYYLIIFTMIAMLMNILLVGTLNDNKSKNKNE